MPNFFNSVEHKLLGATALGFLLLVSAASFAFWETWGETLLRLSQTGFRNKKSVDRRTGTLPQHSPR
jgi:hypothetical protein